MTGPELWLVRHGETEWSRDGRHTGRTDVPLTPAGEDAARSLRPRLAAVAFDLVLCSPLQRATATATLAGVPTPELDDDAREWDYGDYEGITTARIHETDPQWSLWTDGTPGGEQPDDVGARADRLVARVRSTASTRALIVGHGHILRVVAARWIGLAVAGAARLRLDTATVSVLGWERATAVITRWNTPGYDR